MSWGFSQSFWDLSGSGWDSEKPPRERMSSDESLRALGSAKDTTRAIFKSMVVHDKAVLGMLLGSDEYAKEAHLAIFRRQYIFVNHALNDSSCPPDNQRPIRDVLAFVMLNCHHSRPHGGRVAAQRCVQTLQASWTSGATSKHQKSSGLPPQEALIILSGCRVSIPFCFKLTMRTARARMRTVGVVMGQDAMKLSTTRWKASTGSSSYFLAFAMKREKPTDGRHTSPDSRDSSTRQLPLSSTMSHVALPASKTTTSPGTSRQAPMGCLQPMRGYFEIRGLDFSRPTAHESQGKSEGAVFINVSTRTGTSSSADGPDERPRQKLSID
ncbi:MAG: hypothetical protein FRX49_01757 [Trebouxia sp. A1-2]|nr:MAG: hypothetical protein FRX49_01757 [Trebouxia sp. A1-2]